MSLLALPKIKRGEKGKAVRERGESTKPARKRGSRDANREMLRPLLMS
jgi:hypothetical protein